MLSVFVYVPVVSSFQERNEKAIKKASNIAGNMLIRKEELMMNHSKIYVTSKDKKRKT